MALKELVIAVPGKFAALNAEVAANISSSKPLDQPRDARLVMQLLSTVREGNALVQCDAGAAILGMDAATLTTLHHSLWRLYARVRSKAKTVPTATRASGSASSAPHRHPLLRHSPKAAGGGQCAWTRDRQQSVNGHMQSIAARLETLNKEISANVSSARPVDAVGVSKWVTKSLRTVADAKELQQCQLGIKLVLMDAVALHEVHKKLWRLYARVRSSRVHTSRLSPSHANMARATR